MAAGKWSSKDLRAELEKYIASKLGNTQNVIIGIADYRFYLDHDGIAAQGLELQSVKDVAIEYLRKSPNIAFVVDFEKAASSPIPPVIRERILMGYNFHRSGDMLGRRLLVPHMASGIPMMLIFHCCSTGGKCLMEKVL